MKVRPLFDRILVRREEAEEMSAGGLYIPPANQQKVNRCLVVEVGPGILMESGTLMPVPVSKGDTILIGDFAGDAVELDGVAHLIIRATEALAIIQAEEGDV